MLRSRMRAIAGTGLIVAAALFMTACGPEDDSATDAPSASTSVSADESAKSSGGTTGGDKASTGGSDGAAEDGGSTTGGSGDKGTGGTGDKGGTGGDSTGSEDTSANGGGGGQKLVDGELTYLAPGKLMVGDQAFWVAEDTEVWGAGGLCGDGEGQVAEACTLEQLEDAAKRGGTEVTVEMADGVATMVKEGSGI